MEIIQFDKYYTYDDIVSHSISLYNLFAPLISVQSIGVSHDNREILCIKLGYGKKNLIYSAGVHARESVNPIVLLRIIEEYAKSYFGYKLINGMDLRRLLDEYSLIFVPLLNPDGYMISMYGYDTIRNSTLRKKCISKSIDHAQWKYNARGIDINRNFPSISFQATKDMPDCLSENETIAMVNVFNLYESMGYIDFHSRGESIFYYRGYLDKEYNHKQYKIAEALSMISGYTLEKPDEEIPVNDSGGNTVHYYSEVFEKPAITVETVMDEEDFPLNINLRERVLTQIYEIPAIFISLI